MIDVQVGMFPETDPVYEGDRLLERVCALIAKARTSNVPVIYVQHNEGVGEPLETHTNGWDIHPAITPVDGEVVIQKHTPDSFHETNLQDELNSRGIMRLVLAGIQTDLCVDATCRRANSLGYDVIIAEDAHSTWGSSNLRAPDIIDQYNDAFRSFVGVCASQDITF